jgi:hypothetical protein
LLITSNGSYAAVAMPLQEFASVLLIPVVEASPQGENGQHPHEEREVEVVLVRGDEHEIVVFFTAVLGATRTPLLGGGMGLLGCR